LQDDLFTFSFAKATEKVLYKGCLLLLLCKGNRAQGFCFLASAAKEQKKK